MVLCSLLSACAGERSISTRVRLSETAGRISGFLVDGDGRALDDGSVFIDDGSVPAGGPVTDGRFVFDDLAPGDYVINAWRYDSDLSGQLALSLEPGEELDGLVIDVTSPPPEDAMVNADETAPIESEPSEQSELSDQAEVVVERTIRVVNLDERGRVVGLLVRHVDSSWELDSGHREFVQHAAGPGPRTAMDVRVADRDTSVCPDVRGDYLFKCVIVHWDDDVAYVRYSHGARIRGVLRGGLLESNRVSCDGYQAIVSAQGQFAINCPEHAPLVVNDLVALSLPTRVGKELFVEIELR